MSPQFDPRLRGALIVAGALGALVAPGCVGRNKPDANPPEIRTDARPTTHATFEALMDTLSVCNQVVDHFKGKSDFVVVISPELHVDPNGGSLEQLARLEEAHLVRFEQVAQRWVGARYLTEGEVGLLTPDLFLREAKQLGQQSGDTSQVRIQRILDNNPITLAMDREGISYSDSILYGLETPRSDLIASVGVYAERFFLALGRDLEEPLAQDSRQVVLDGDLLSRLNDVLHAMQFYHCPEARHIRLPDPKLFQVIAQDGYAMTVVPASAVGELQDLTMSYFEWREKFAHAAREDEWVKSIRQQSLPGGVSLVRLGMRHVDTGIDMHRTTPTLSSRLRDKGISFIVLGPIGPVPLDQIKEQP